jgi:hypothetical protein
LEARIRRSQAISNTIETVKYEFRVKFVHRPESLDVFGIRIAKGKMAAYVRAHDRDVG